MTEPPIIDHDPDEPPPDRTGNGIYWAAFVVLAVLWAGNLLTRAIDWQSLFLGAGTGLFIAIWGIAITGNKTPKWMR